MDKHGIDLEIGRGEGIDSDEDLDDSASIPSSVGERTSIQPGAMNFQTIFNKDNTAEESYDRCFEDDLENQESYDEEDLEPASKTVAGNTKLKSYGNNKQMRYITARGDGSLGAIQEVDAEYESTLRHTALQSEIGKKSAISGINFSNADEESYSTHKSNNPNSIHLTNDESKPRMTYDQYRPPLDIIEEDKVAQKTNKSKREDNSDSEESEEEYKSKKSKKSAKSKKSNKSKKSKKSQGSQKPPVIYRPQEESSSEELDIEEEESKKSSKSRKSRKTEKSKKSQKPPPEIAKSERSLKSHASTHKTLKSKSKKSLESKIEHNNSVSSDSYKSSDEEEKKKSDTDRDVILRAIKKEKSSEEDNTGYESSEESKISHAKKPISSESGSFNTDSVSNDNVMVDKDDPHTITMAKKISIEEQQMTEEDKMIEKLKEKIGSMKDEIQTRWGEFDRLRRGVNNRESAHNNKNKLLFISEFEQIANKNETDMLDREMFRPGKFKQKHLRNK